MKKNKSAILIVILWIGFLILSLWKKAPIYVGASIGFIVVALTEITNKAIFKKSYSGWMLLAHAIAALISACIGVFYDNNIAMFVLGFTIPLIMEWFKGWEQIETEKEKRKNYEVKNEREN